MAKVATKSSGKTKSGANKSSGTTKSGAGGNRNTNNNNSSNSNNDVSAAFSCDIARVFQDVHRTAANSQRGKRSLLAAGRTNLEACVAAVCDVVLIILKQTPTITADALKRHFAFLGEVSKAFRDELQSDELAVRVMRAVLPFQNAQDKSVRLAIVSTFDTLLKAVDQTNTTEERQDFYQVCAEYLKCCLHDRSPAVRERAVSAVAAFQTGKKDCDVTQQLLALLCTDTNADVRRQILSAVAPRKEFLEGYFHGMVRSVRDAVARVRTAAWDALGRFPWRYITAYATAKNVSLPDLLKEGLGDTNASAYIACRATLTNCWLHRDCKDDCCGILTPICSGYVLPSLVPFDVICQELLSYTHKRQPSHSPAAAALFPLDLSDVHTAAILMWKASCRLASDTEGMDEAALLLPLEQFGAVLQDTIYAYAKPDAAPKVVTFRNVEDADNMLRIFLSVFPIYEDGGYLAHTDNTTRNSLLKQLNFLLKVVPDDDPALFVDVAVRSLKSITARTPEEASKTVTSALDSLFRSLKLPQRYEVGYDDVEALERKSRERQEELLRRKVLVRTGGATQAEYEELRDEMDRDEKFLLRMQLIVLAFLSHSQRGDPIPTFCSHIIQLGRHLTNERVRVAATKSLGLQCLISPESVHTFMPLILADARARPAPGVSPETDECLPLTAIGVVFDLLGEYGVSFFNTVRGHQPVVLNPDNSAEARMQLELNLAEEDVHKVGGARLLEVLEGFLSPREADKNAITIVGFCKLLSCNRLPTDRVPVILCKLLLHYAATWDTRRAGASSAATTTATTAAAGTPHQMLRSYIHDTLGTFFASYTASHPRRQDDFARAGVTAVAALLEAGAAVAAKLLPYVARLSDAYMLAHVRDIDPDTVRRVKESAAAAAEEAEGDGAGEAAAGSSSRIAATRASMQSGRLARELSRFSVHERLAAALLSVIADVCGAAESEETEGTDRGEDSDETRGGRRLYALSTCLQSLENGMYLYSKEPQHYLHFCVDRAVECVRATGAPETTTQRFEEWVEHLRAGGRPAPARASGGEEGPDGGAHTPAAMQKQWEDTLRHRRHALEQLRAEGFMEGYPVAKEVAAMAAAATTTHHDAASVSSGTPTAASVAAPPTLSGAARAGLGSKRANPTSSGTVARDDFFNVDSIVGAPSSSSSTKRQRTK